jgi:hypothetical protein
MSMQLLKSDMWKELNIMNYIAWRRSPSFLPVVCHIVKWPKSGPAEIHRYINQHLFYTDITTK